MNKNDIRKEIIKKRSLLDDNEVNNASKIIINRLKDLYELKSAKVIFSYMPYGKEVNIKPLNQWILDQSKILCLPRVISQTEMETRTVTNINHGLEKSSYGILEPTENNELTDIEKIDLILVPGIAFDKAGNRMGHGNGYYDRFLSRCPKSTLFIGISYSFQVFDAIPSYQYDVKMHKIITENFTIKYEGKYEP